MSGPFDFPRPPSPPGKRNPWVSPMSAACLIAWIGYTFNAKVIATDFFILAFLCFVLAVFYDFTKP
jgi:hypothetical protein